MFRSSRHAGTHTVSHSPYVIGMTSLSRGTDMGCVGLKEQTSEHEQNIMFSSSAVCKGIWWNLEQKITHSERKHCTHK